MSYADVQSPAVPDVVPAAPILTDDQKWTDAYAKNIVRSDFAYAEAYRTHAHDWRYRNAMELYLAWAGQRYWDGTRVPRSSLGIYVVFEQIEAMLPKIVAALCDQDSYNFYSLRSDQKDAALAWKRLIQGQLDEVNYREQIRRICKSSLVYGNGILEIGMEDYDDENVQFDASKRITGMKIIPHPTFGNIPMPTGFEDSYSRKVQTERKVRPYIRYVSIIDSYIDPNCESTIMQEAGYYIKRVYMRLEDVKALKKNKKFNIPDDEILSRYSMSKTTSNQDVTKLSAEIFRYNMWNPSQDYTSDPAQKRIEVIEYTTKARKVWLLNREHVAYNQRNKYGEINFYSMHYADVLDRWHALAISDVAEGEQRLQQSIINARVDELALSIHRPMVKRRGVTIPPYQLKVRPGVVIETEVPEGDIKQLEVQNITQQAFIEVAASSARVQGMTGITDLAAMGTPSAGGNSANRTATGVNTQAGATQDRVGYYIQNGETLVIEPVLNAMIRYNKKFLDMKQAANWIKLDPQFKHLNPVDVMNAQVKAECRASIRLRARMGFLQIFPQLSQVFLNPESLQMLATQQKKTFNIEEWEYMAMDAIQYSTRNPLFIPMTPDQIKAMQTPPPDVRAKMAMQQQQTQSDEKIKGGQNITKLLAVLIKEMLKKHTDMAQMDDDHIHKLIEAETAADAAENDAGGSEGTD